MAANFPELGSEWQAFKNLGEPEGSRDGSTQSDLGFLSSFPLLSSVPSKTGPNFEEPAGRVPGLTARRWGRARRWHGASVPDSDHPPPQPWAARAAIGAGGCH